MMNRKSPDGTGTPRPFIRLKSLLLLALTGSASLLCAQDRAWEIRKDPPPGGPVKAHPRLILSEADLEKLKARAGKDPVLARCVEDLMTAARKAVDKPQLAYQKIGPWLLHVSRDCLERTYALALAWRWTGEEAYARAAEANLLTVCGFPDWNPSHFLDTAEMCHAVGVGYDWLFRRLDEETRDRIRTGLIEKGLDPGVEAYGKAWWVRSPFNWNQVCNSGLIIGALSIAGTHPSYARDMLPAALESLPRALETYRPDGAWPEGPGYWNYATSYTVFGLAAMKTALGTDYGLSEHPGLDASGFFPVHGSGPTGLYLNFADSGSFSRRTTLPTLFWLAERYGHPFLAAEEHAMVARYGASPLHVIWYVPPPAETDVEAQPLDRLFRGAVEVAVFRSAWKDPEACYLGVKAGYNQVNHGHLDLGNFELDALGVRWIRDLGSDDYNLPGYWDGGKGGQRWTYYRLRSASHNVPLLGGEDQDPLGTAKILRFESRADAGFAVLDLSPAYHRRASRVLRGVALAGNRRIAWIQDEFDIEKPCDITLGLTTDADIEILGDATARLTMEDKTLEARILSPASAAFSVASAEQAPPEKVNKGVRRLMVRLEDQSGKVCIALCFTPVVRGKAAPPPPIQPLADWR